MILPTLTPLTVVASLIFGLTTAVYAKKRGKNPYFWFLLGACFGILGVFFLFFMPKPKPAVKPVFLPIPKNVFWFYIDRQNQQRGPFAFNVLQQAHACGHLGSDSYVWNQTLEKWEPFARFL